MSLQDALSFIEKIQARPELKEQVRQTAEESDLNRLVDLGRKLGFSFSTGELNTAFARDWAMRRFRFFSGAST